MSCNQTIYMKKGDRLPSLYYWLEGPEPLTAPDSVSFKFEPAAGGSVTSGAATVLGVVGGRVQVRYDWGASDTTTAGTFRCEFVAVYSGKDMTFPNGDGIASPQYLTMIISDDVS